MPTAPSSTPAPGPQTRPPFDPELAAVLDVLREQLPPTITPDMIAPMREANVTPPIEEIPHAALSRAMTAARTAWVERLLQP